MKEKKDRIELQHPALTAVRSYLIKTQRTADRIFLASTAVVGISGVLKKITLASLVGFIPLELAQPLSMILLPILAGGAGVMVGSGIWVGGTRLLIRTTERFGAKK